MDGWIKLHRSIRSHWLYNTKKAKTRREAWEDILMLVNYESKKVLIRGQLYDCNRGQSLFSLENWAKEFNWSIQQVRTFFKLLENDKMITIEGMQYTTRLTVCNYDCYQGLATDEQQTNEQTNNIPLTDEQQTANRPLTTTKERKERKKDKNNTPELSDENSEYILESDLKTKKEGEEKSCAKKERFENVFENYETNKSWSELLKMKKWVKKEDSAIQKSIDKLKEFDEDFAKELIDKAISGEYQGVVYSNTKEEYQKWLNQRNGTNKANNQTATRQPEHIHNADGVDYNQKFKWQ